MTNDARSQPVSFIGVRFLNACPLLAGLHAGVPAPFPYHFETADPSVCAARLARGEADVGLVPVGALPELPGFRIVPSLGVACRAAVTSVLLLSRVPLAGVRVLAAHTASRTSVALARLLLAERWGARPRVEPADPPLEAMLAGADAAVLIGDAALKVHGRSPYLEVDLGGEWVAWTGLPFVFAVWAVRRDAPAGVDALLEASLAYAAEHWNDLVPAWAVVHGVPVEVTRHYLEQVLHHRLGEAEQAGIREFLRRAAASGVLPSCDAHWHAA